MRKVVAALSAAIVGAAACGYTGAASRDVPPEAEGGLPPAPPEEAGRGDGPTEIFLDASDGDGSLLDADTSGCTTVIDDRFLTTALEWDVLGSGAAIVTGRARLTLANVGGQPGAIWWKPPITFGARLVVTLDLVLDRPDSGAPGDGLAIAWATSPYKIGGAAQQFGLCNVDIMGVGAKLDTKDDDIAVLSAIGTNNCTANGALVPVTSAMAVKKLTLEITPTTITFTTDTGASVTRTQVSPTTGQLGITAANGGSKSGHAVTAIKVSSCP